MSIAAYTFPPSLSFTTNVTINCLIADIPVIAAGFLGLGTVMFSLVLKKLDLAMMFLSASTLLNFIAALFDMAQIIVHSSEGDLSSSTASPFALVRDIFFSVATGTRFLFFWAIVAQCPRGERIQQRYQTDSKHSFLSSNVTVHSGSWLRWGLVGIVLKWATAAIAIAIALLQILWRAVNPFNKLGPVYAVEASLEIVVSVIFIIKLFLTSAIAETPSRLATLTSFTPMVSVLVISAGIGSGNLADFAFSESSVGRLLLAIELYIAIETALIWKFYVTDQPEPEFINKRASSFQGLRLDAVSSLLELPGNLAGAVSQSPKPVSRISEAGRRLSTWMRRSTSGLTGQYHTTPERDRAQLIEPTEVEQGLSPTTTENATMAYDLSPTDAKESAKYPDPLYTSFFIESQREISHKNYPSDGPKQQAAFRQDSQSNRTSITLPIKRVSSDNEAAVKVPPLATVRNRSELDSPVFGLDGIIRAGRLSPTSAYSPTVIPTSPATISRGPLVRSSSKAMTSEFGKRLTMDTEATVSTRSSGYNQLMRDQDELERSIAQLRLFATMAESSAVADGKLNSTRSSEMTHSRDSAPRADETPTSASVKSEFSLSHFPEPPLARRTSGVVSESKIDDTSSGHDEGKTIYAMQNTNRSSVFSDLVPPKMPAAMEQIIPSSTRTSDHSNFMSLGLRPGSAGTQYDVTSFIGDLTIPGHKTFNSMLTVAVDEEMSDVGSTASATIVAIDRHPSTGQAARAYRLESEKLKESMAMNKSKPVTRGRPEPTDLPAEDESVVDDTSIRTISPSATIIATNHSPRVDYARMPSGRTVGLPARPRMIGLPQRVSDEVNPLAYERPRPAPTYPQLLQ